MSEPIGPATPAQKNWFLRHKVISTLLGLFIIGTIGNAFGGEEPAPKEGVGDSPAASSSPSGSAKPKPGPTATDPTTAFKKAVKGDLGPGDKVTAVTLTKRPGGSYDVKGTIEAHEALQSKNAPKAIREAAYHFMFAAYKQNAIRVNSVTADVTYELVDATGNTARERVYEGLISAAVGAKLNTSSDDKYYSINWGVIVQAIYEHPALG